MSHGASGFALKIARETPCESKWSILGDGYCVKSAAESRMVGKLTFAIVEDGRWSGNFYSAKARALSINRPKAPGSVSHTSIVSIFFSMGFRGVPEQ